MLATYLRLVEHPIIPGQPGSVGAGQPAMLATLIPPTVSGCWSLLHADSNSGCPTHVLVEIAKCSYWMGYANSKPNNPPNTPPNKPFLHPSLINLKRLHQHRPQIAKNSDCTPARRQSPKNASAPSNSSPTSIPKQHPKLHAPNHPAVAKTRPCRPLHAPIAKCERTVTSTPESTPKSTPKQHLRQHAKLLAP